MPQQGFVSLRRLVKRLHVFERNHEHVCRRLRIDVLDDDAAIILMNKLGGNLAGYDFAKQAICFRHCFGLDSVATNPIRLDNFSEPVADLEMLKPLDDF